MPIPPLQDEQVPVEQRRLAELEDFRAYLVAKGGTADDQILSLLLDGASERLNDWRQFYPSGPLTRTLHLEGTGFTHLPDLCLTKESTILADGQDLSADEIRFLRKADHPAHALVIYRPVGLLEVTGYWGFAEPPPGIREACMAWAARAFFTRQARQADAVADPETGAAASWYARVPSQVRVALQPYEVPGL